MERLGANIKKYRKEKKLSQTEFGKLLGVNRGAVSMWETGETQPYGKLDKIAEVLGISTIELIGSSDEYQDMKDVADFLDNQIRFEDDEYIIRKYLQLDEFGKKEIRDHIISAHNRCDMIGTLGKEDDYIVRVWWLGDYEGEQSEAPDFPALLK